MARYTEWILEEGILNVEGWARDGLTDKQIAYNIGISEQTLNVWKKKYTSLFESLKKWAGPKFGRLRMTAQFWAAKYKREFPPIEPMTRCTNSVILQRDKKQVAQTHLFRSSAIVKSKHHIPLPLNLVTPRSSMVVVTIPSWPLFSHSSWSTESVPQCVCILPPL